MADLKDIFNPDEEQQQTPLNLLDPLTNLFITAAAGRSALQQRLLNPDPEEMANNLADALMPPKDPEDLANWAANFIGPTKLSGTRVMASFHPAGRSSKGVNWRPIEAVTRYLKQKGIEKLPKEWVEGVKRYAIYGGRSPDNSPAYWDMTTEDWSKDPFKAFARKEMPPPTPFGTLHLEKDYLQSDPATLAHEISHEGFQRILPEERHQFMYEYLKQKDLFDTLYHGRRGAAPSAYLLNKWPDRETALWNIYQKANEVFAMAAADKATRSAARTKFLKVSSLPEGKGPGVYGALSPKARKIIDKYVKSIGMTLGIPALAEGMKEGEEE